MVLNELQQQNSVTELTRFQLAVSAFNRISQYDGAISDYLSSLDLSTEQRSIFPGQANGRFIKLQDLRYGENPHQLAAFYRDTHPAPGSLVTARQLQGKELSYNNIADADAAWECVKSFDSPACVIVKHANPCCSHKTTASVGAFLKSSCAVLGNLPPNGLTRKPLSGKFRPKAQPRPKQSFRSLDHAHQSRCQTRQPSRQPSQRPGGPRDWPRGGCGL
jgi:hypothetical protein